MPLCIWNEILGSIKTIREPHSHTLWLPHPCELFAYLPFDELTSGQQKKTIRETAAIWYDMSTVQILLRILTYSSYSTCLKEDLKKMVPQAFRQRRIMLPLRKRVCLEIVTSCNQLHRIRYLESNFCSPLLNLVAYLLVSWIYFSFLFFSSLFSNHLGFLVYLFYLQWPQILFFNCQGPRILFWMRQIKNKYELCGQCYHLHIQITK